MPVQLPAKLPTLLLTPAAGLSAYLGQIWVRDSLLYQDQWISTIPSQWAQIPETAITSVAIVIVIPVFGNLQSFCITLFQTFVPSKHCTEIVIHLYLF